MCSVCVYSGDDVSRGCTIALCHHTPFPLSRPYRKHCIVVVLTGTHLSLYLHIDCCSYDFKIQTLHFSIFTSLSDLGMYVDIYIWVGNILITVDFIIIKNVFGPGWPVARTEDR